MLRIYVWVCHSKNEKDKTLRVFVFNYVCVLNCSKIYGKRTVYLGKSEINLLKIELNQHGCGWVVIRVHAVWQTMTSLNNSYEFVISFENFPYIQAIQNMKCILSKYLDTDRIHKTFWQIKLVDAIRIEEIASSNQLNLITVQHFFGVTVFCKTTRLKATSLIKNNNKSKWTRLAFEQENLIFYTSVNKTSKSA